MDRINRSQSKYRDRIGVLTWFTNRLKTENEIGVGI